MHKILIVFLILFFSLKNSYSDNNIKDNSPDKGIVIEDKSNPEKNQSYEFKPSDIFKASDLMVDSLTQLLAKERSKKQANN